MRLVIIPKDGRRRSHRTEQNGAPKEADSFAILRARQQADHRRATSDFGQNLSLCHGTRTAHVRDCLPTSVSLKHKMGTASKIHNTDDALSLSLSVGFNIDLNMNKILV